MTTRHPKRLIVFGLIMVIMLFAVSGFGPCLCFVIQVRLWNEELEVTDVEQIVHPSSSQLVWAFNSASRELIARHGLPTTCRLSTNAASMEKGMTWHKEDTWLTLQACADLSANWITLTKKPLDIPSVAGEPFSTTQDYILRSDYFERFP